MEQEKRRLRRRAARWERRLLTALATAPVSYTHLTLPTT